MRKPCCPKCLWKNLVSVHPEMNELKRQMDDYVFNQVATKILDEVTIDVKQFKATQAMKRRKSRYRSRRQLRDPIIKSLMGKVPDKGPELKLVHIKSLDEFHKFANHKKEDSA